MADVSGILSDGGDDKTHIGHMAVIVGLSYAEIIDYVSSHDSDSELDPTPHTLFAYPPDEDGDDRESSILKTISSVSH